MTDTVSVPRLGSSMPDISLIGSDGTTSTLERQRGSGQSVVFFMRASTCAICLAHARTILKMEETGELAGGRFVLIAPGGRDDASTATARLGSPEVSVWASGTQHAAVGLGTFLSIQHSGTFVLDELGVILYAKTAVIPVSSFSRSEVAAVLA